MIIGTRAKRSFACDGAPVAIPVDSSDNLGGNLQKATKDRSMAHHPPLKHRWSIGNNYLSGITLGRWLSLLRENKFAIDPVYWHRGIFLTAMSCLNSVAAWIEQLRFARAIQRTQITQPPVFILGHWRSGTTHLHNLLALDSQFAYPNTYQVVSPFTFLTTEAINTRLFRSLVPSKRPMDNMHMSFASPQEDELALCMKSLRSVYLTITFPRQERYDAEFLTFENASPSDTRRWQDALLWFAQKLTYKYGRPLLLKSPSHTARIRLILEVFPQARFVHIHRHPYDVFRSTQRYWDTAAWYTYLQRPDRSRTDDEILQRYVRLYDAYFEQRPLIPADRFHELSFVDLENSPLQQIELLYRKLEMDGFERVQPRLTHYLDSLKGYQKNRHSDLAEDMRRRVAKQWRRSFDAWGYPT